MKSFTEQLAALNPAQRQAVETIDGPVLVVAGPGTGKTQLLSMRAANIVHSTDSAPNNILCLTFTDSAASAMRQRLISLMGPDGNKVAVHTFHSFGTEIINQNPEHFYNGARFAPASDMAGYEILREVFENLPHSSPLARKMNDEFTSLKDARNAISNLKRAGLLPSELLDILSHNELFCDFAEPKLRQVFGPRLSKKDLPKIAEAATEIASFSQPPVPLETFHSLSEVCVRELTSALAEAEAVGKTTAVTAWRNRWLEKNTAGEYAFKDRKLSKKLRSLAEVYKKYRARLTESELFDFDDMVSLVAHTLETTPELRFNLQEQYLYIMVDEFQDTNGAQLRLLHALADSPVSEGRPNVLAVGDDDQAIYAFQGAELSNILDFTNRYHDVAVITLTENYRSTGLVLDHARRVITQGTERLETTLRGVNKTLTPHNSSADTTVELHQFETPAGEYQWVADQIDKQLKNGVPASEIAVLARHHKQLIELLPYMHANNLATNYEKRSNVLENPQVRELITLAEVVVYLADRRFDLAEELLPELLSYDFWGVTTKELWQLSLRAFKERRMWLELMVEGEGKLKQIAEFIIIASHQAQHESLEAMLDILIGASEEQVPNDDTENGDLKPSGPREETYVSPFRDFYFNEKQLQQNPTAYIDLLGSLRSLRQAATNYRPGETLNLANLLDLISLHERTSTPIVDSGQVKESLSGVTLMTAHKAKGLEFATVFVLSCQDDVWGRRARKHGSSLHFPHNLPIEPAGENYNDALRLFFVALTRAKQNLYLSTHQTNNAGKPSLLAEFLQDESLAVTAHDVQVSDGPQNRSLSWEQHWLGISPADQKILLQPTLENYKLSATHLNNFIDITRGGPQAFLLQNLLRFPQAMSPQQVFGHIVHAVLQRAHTHLSATGERRPLEDIFYDYELQLQRSHLGERETTYLLEKGSDVLHTYLAERYESFKPSQKAERNFYGQNVVVGNARLTGAIDLMEIDTAAKTATVIDYKTGKSFASWHTTTDAEKIKLHKYKQQLMFYKLLVENARDFSAYKVHKGVLEFVETDEEGKINQLETTFNADELAAFSKLIAAVWQRIQSLDFPDTSHYPLSYKGILEFEADLLK